MQRSERPQRRESIKRPVLVQQPAEDPPSPFMPAKDAATLMGVSADHVTRAVRAGAIPGYKWGTVYRVLRAFVEDLCTEVSSGKSIVVEDYAAAWIENAKAVA